MSLPGLFVEYLVIGYIALTWLIPWFYFGQSSFLKNEASVLAIVFVPFAYVIGMLVDSIGHRTLRKPRTWIRRKTYSKYQNSEIDIEGLKARLLVHAPEVAKTYEMYSSRDRIARGLFVNSVIATISLGFLAGIYSSGLTVVITVIACVIICVMSCALWADYKRRTCIFEVFSLRALKEKFGVSTHQGEIEQNVVAPTNEISVIKIEKTSAKG